MENFRKHGPMNKGMFPMPEADVSHIRRKWLDIPYATISQTQKLDIYLPDEGDGPFPVILSIHGGGFEMGDKRNAHLQSFLEGIKRGYAVVSVNYRLSGEAIFPSAVQDIKASIRWLGANGEKYHLDGNRIAACGGSAGGHLSAMICLTANVSVFDDANLGNSEYPCNVQAAVDWFGPTDFSKMDEQIAESGLGSGDHNKEYSPESKYMGARITEIPEEVQIANPLTYIHEDMPPILIQHGRLDDLVPVQQSIIFAEKLEKYVSPDRFEFEIIENAGHGDPLFETKENMNKVFAFLDKHLK